MSLFGRYLGLGVTVRYDFSTTGIKKTPKQIYYAQFLLIYFEKTGVQVTIFFHLDMKVLNIIRLLFM